jgi:hypothetical protein
MDGENNKFIPLLVVVVVVVVVGASVRLCDHNGWLSIGFVS